MFHISKSDMFLFNEKGHIIITALMINEHFKGFMFLETIYKL